MNVPAQLTVPYRPSLKLIAPNEPDFEMASNLKRYLNQLTEDAQGIISAIILFDYCSANKCVGLWSDWQFMACRDCSIKIFNCWITLEKIKNIYGKVKIYRPLVDGAKIRKARKDFDLLFPFSQKMRTAAAHPEFVPNPDKDISVTKDQSGIWPILSQLNQVTITGLINGHNYICTMDGVAAYQNMHPDTGISLISIVREVFAAFEKLDPAYGIMPRRS